MKCVVTAGPTYEPLDEVRRLTNFSTGKLGTELANHLADAGHEVILLRGSSATHHGEVRAAKVQSFTTTADLRDRLHSLAGKRVGAIFHAAAVSDFAFGKVWERTPEGQLVECRSGKVSTRSGTLLAELLSTPKIIATLRNKFPNAKLVGWKYEVEGSRAGVIAKGKQQLAECRTDACVVNGRAYGKGFGLMTSKGGCKHLSTGSQLYAALEKLLK
jgi:phosphopantothenoylcysteine synthetase/decarboxylase